jgi:hypothetical protein
MLHVCLMCTQFQDVLFRDMLVFTLLSFMLTFVMFMFYLDCANARDVFFFFL